MVSTTLFAVLASAGAILAAPAIEQREASESPIQVTLEAPQDPVSHVDDAKVVATITNTGTEPITLANSPNSILSTWNTNTFDVKGASENSVSFAGYKVKYADSKVSRTTLAAGESITVEHALSGAYNFAHPGTYTVAPISDVLTTVDEAGNIASVPVAAPSVSFVLDDAANLVPAAKHVAKSGPSPIVANPGSTLGKRASFPSCTSSETSQLQQAIPAAQSYTSEALTVLRSTTSSSVPARYTTWFGAFSASRLSTVTSHYTNINAQDWNSFTFDCSCQEAGTWAFVNPGTFGTIHLCLEFWNHAVTNVQDSKAGTLIHESSHFTRNGGTQDYIYQPSGAKSLARSNPAEAVMNADNHEYFCESRDVAL